MQRRFEAKTVALGALGLWLLLAVPPVRSWFELTMVRHMVLQLPLLALIGACLGAA